MLAYFALISAINYQRYFCLRRRFALTNLRPLKAMKMVMRGTAAQILLTALTIVTILASRFYVGPFWPIGPIAFFALLFIMIFLQTPKKVLHFKTKPYGKPGDTQVFKDFAKQHGFDNVEIGCLKASEVGKEATALCMNRRGKLLVYFSDTIKEILDETELQAVFAHELGHLKNRDNTKNLIWQFFTLLVVLGCIYAALPVKAPNEKSLWQAIDAVPLVLLISWLVAFALRPFTLALSRYRENLATLWALKATNNPSACISMSEKLAENNLICRKISWWEKLFFTSHPTLDDVIKQARQYAIKNGIE